MSKPRPRYSAEETARRGDELYQQQIRAQVERDNAGKIVAIDIETGAYAVGDTVLDAARRLSAQQPAAEAWFIRIGHPALHRIGGVFGGES